MLRWGPCSHRNTICSIVAAVESIQASVRALSYSCYHAPHTFKLCFRTPTRQTGCSFLFNENFRFRPHICKVSILIWQLATGGTSPHPPHCNSCPARLWRRWKNPSVCPPLGILLPPLPPVQVCSVSEHQNITIVVSLGFWLSSKTLLCALVSGDWLFLPPKPIAENSRAS